MQPVIRVGDRENDIYEFYCATQELGTHFVVRPASIVWPAMASTPCRPRWPRSLSRTSPVRNRRRQPGEIGTDRKRQSAFCAIGEARRYPPLSLTVIHAIEVEPPDGRKPIDWKLLADLPVETGGSGDRKMSWYAMRWKIELFFKILKSGFNAETEAARG